MTAKTFGLGMEEKAPPKPTPAQHAWGAYRKIRKRVQETKQQQREEAIARGEDQVEVRRRQQGALEREVRARHAAGNVLKRQWRLNRKFRKKASRWKRTRRSQRTVADHALRAPR